MYGVSFSAANWVWSARQLVAPLIVRRLLGPEGVAYINLAMRVVEALSFVRAATWRLSVAALAKVQADAVRLRRVMKEAAMLQVSASRRSCASARSGSWHSLGCSATPRRR